MGGGLLKYPPLLIKFEKGKIYSNEQVDLFYNYCSNNYNFL